MDPFGRKYSWNDAKEDGREKDCFGTCGHGLKLDLTLLTLRLCRWTVALELNLHLLFPKSKHSHEVIPDFCCSLNHQAAKAHPNEWDKACDQQ